jgi:hypothetical protein
MSHAFHLLTLLAAGAAQVSSIPPKLTAEEVVAHHQQMIRQLVDRPCGADAKAEEIAVCGQRPDDRRYRVPPTDDGRFADVGKPLLKFEAGPLEIGCCTTQTATGVTTGISAKISFDGLIRPP